MVVQKEPQSVMIKTTEINQRKESLNGYITEDTRKIQLKNRVNNTDGNLSTDSGLIVIKEFMD